MKYLKMSAFLKNTIRGLFAKITSLFHNPYKIIGISWLKVKYYKHLPPGKLRKQRLNGKYIYFLSPQELLHGLNEVFIDEIYSINLPDNPLIVDCGANIGLSIIFFKKEHPGATITAFEPDEKNFELLTKNIDSHELKGISLLKKAVWKQNTILDFSNESSMSSKIQNGKIPGSKKVEAIRLGDWLNQKVHFLKIDIEGAEFEVLTDIETKLSNVDNMFIEYHGTFQQEKELTRIINIISLAGFQYYIKEALPIYQSPFKRIKNPAINYDIQLNIFCFRK